MRIIKFHLTVNGVEHELGADQVKNWDDIKCSWKRKDLSGVVRSFTSKFEFVNEARRLLIAEYQRMEAEGRASVALYVMGDTWEYSKVFECPLDFSTYSEKRGVVSISATDNSVAALIKASKSTKYEYAIGTDVEADDSMVFDRIPMKEFAEYAITGGESQTDGSLVLDSSQEYIGLIQSEVSVGGSVYFKDDQEPDSTDADTVTSTESDRTNPAAQLNRSAGYILRGMKATEIAMKMSIAYSAKWKNTTYVNRTESFTVPQMRKNIYLFDYGSVPTNNRTGGTNYDVVAQYTLECIGSVCLGTFASASALQSAHPTMPVSDGSIQHAIIGGTVWKLTATGINNDKTQFTYIANNTGHTSEYYDRMEIELTQTFTLGYSKVIAIGSAIGSGVSYEGLHIHDSSFYFSWISIGDPVDIPTFSPLRVLTALCSSMMNGRARLTPHISAHDTRLANTRILAAESVRAIQTAKLYTSFNEFCDWMETVFGYTYYLEDVPAVVEAGEVVEEAYTAMRFVHLSELFDDHANVKVIAEASNVQFSVDGSMIYSSIDVGYEKKDYDSINGRDEFNFSNEYTTGSIVSDKRLQLRSKYRADGYGIEFAVQKRGKDTTDTDSDQDVFFVLVGSDGKPDRTTPVVGSLNDDKVLNAAFSPMACIRANRERIGAQARTLTLAFASSTGNSDVAIGGVAMTANHSLNSRLFTAGQLSFETNDMSMPGTTGDLVKVSYDGLTYIGYISEIEMRIGKPQSAKYKLIIKSRYAEQ